MAHISCGISEIDGVENFIRNYNFHNGEELLILCRKPCSARSVYLAIAIASNISNKQAVLNIVNHYKSHPSINFVIEEEFSFKQTTSEDICKLLKNLNEHKAIGDDNIPPKILKLAADTICTPLSITINSSINEINFPAKAKSAVVAPLFKAGDKTDKRNYRSVSILNSISKIFENVLKDQIVPFFEKLLSKFMSAYRKGHSPHHVLMRLTENWRKSLDMSKLVGIVFMDLSKAFDSIPHDLITAKLKAYVLSNDAVTYIYAYLKDRKQCVKIKESKSKYNNIISGVPQGSILGPILFNVFLNDLFLFIKVANLHNYADDNALEAHASNIDDLINILQQESNNAVDWLENNDMIPNPKKFHAIISTKNNNNNNNNNVIAVPIKIKGKTIYSENAISFLGITLDNELKFDQHIALLCSKAAKQLNALYRIKRFLTPEMKNILVNSFIYSNFNYYPLVWHFSSANSIRMIEKIQERLLRFQLNNFYSTYEELLKIADKSTMLVWRLKSLCLQIYKTINDENPVYMNNIFKRPCNRHSSRFPNNLYVSRANQVTYGSKSLNALGPKVWNELPEAIKASDSIAIFKRNIKRWEGPACGCNFCNLLLHPN